MNKIVSSNNMFEDIKHTNEEGVEYWSARELQVALDYKKWQKFNNVINYAKIACKASNNAISDHFTQVGKLVEIGSDTKRNVSDYHLSRYACYLIAQNADPRKEVVALAQTYFAIQTRKQELNELAYSKLSEDEKRLYHRKQVSVGNYALNKAAAASGVKNFDKFHNAGYKGLYGGETADDIAKRKGLRYREDILDNMGSTELAANLFRITQTDDKLKRDKICTEKASCDTHFEVGKEVRNSIKRMGGVMPENLPNPNISLKEIDKINNIDNVIKNS